MAKLLNFLLLAICGTITAAEPSIPALATSDDDLSTLVTALKAANLVSALSEPGPFTVFAPTNEAFAMVPPDALKTLLKPENVGKLTGVLTYHVVPGKFNANDLGNGQMLKTLEGQYLGVMKDSAGNVVINNAQVTTADLNASNGVVHIIDGVLFPKISETMLVADAPTIPALAASVPDLSTLVAAVKAAKLVDTLSGPGPFTVFAPTNEAFAALPKGVLQDLLKPENVWKLTMILTFHVVAGDVHAADLQDGQVVTTLEGETLNVVKNTTGVFINDAQVVKPDVDASNGVVHVINQVLVPRA